MATSAEITLGDLVRDKITGFEGIAIGRTEWLNRCVRIVVQSQKLDKGAPVEPQSFDVEQLDVVTSQKVKMEQKEQTGGPRGYREERFPRTSRRKEPRR